ncbi:helix-turn-helix transcriptional regulator [Clostridium sp. YIM B02500]|uniref:helix-turn-helix domain-containing protein n=1 Tax=Clostridium sp. YIM B02500 TaxID=2910681 RepID=UPI001EEEB3D8|nr:helix-turn-helix transcriptional regulator [Clostridium sp. YIM B02500]
MKQVSLEIFAKRLKTLREEHGLSTRALGEIVGTSNATISRYETGKRDPDLVLVHNIAKYFNVTIEYLCGEDVNSDEESLINMFSKLSEESKKDAIKYITYLYEKER